MTKRILLIAMLLIFPWHIVSQIMTIIKPEKVIPIHVAPSNATEQQKQQNIDKFIPPNKLIMKEGDTIYL